MDTDLQTVYDSFLIKVEDYNYLDLTEEELATELYQLAKSSVAKFTVAENIGINEYTEKFTREITQLEIEILAYGMVLSWVEPKINSVEVLRQRLASKEYQIFSQANHIKELKEIKVQASKDFNYWVTRYSSDKALKELLDR